VEKSISVLSHSTFDSEMTFEETLIENVREVRVRVIDVLHVLQCVAVCCSVWQCAAVCYRVLQRVAV